MRNAKRGMGNWSQTEPLETRRLLTSFTAASVAELIADINAANATGGANSITLAPRTTFKLDAVDNNTFGPNGLPSVAAGDELTIVGNGDTIQLGNAAPACRLFLVAPGASLSLNDLTLSRGSGAGGAVYSQGTLSLNGVTVQNCINQGGPGGGAAGGGIYSTGVLTITDSLIQNNQALGGDGDGSFTFSRPGGDALGGGLYIGGGTASVTNSTFSSNLARGGNGANGGRDVLYASSGGSGLGGAIFVGAGTLAVRGTTLTHNTAAGGAAGHLHSKIPNEFIRDGAGSGGGLYIAPTALVSLDTFTQTNTRSNTASSSGDDIFGTFTIL